MKWALFILSLTIPAAEGSKLFGQSDGEELLLQLMSERKEDFGAILLNPDRFRVQVLYTQINRDSNNVPHFRSHAYRVNPEEYFYPASTVKIFGAALALEKVNHLNVPGLDRNTWMKIDSSFSGQQRVTIDTSAASGKPSIAHYIKKMLVVSDNDAYNRIYEFLGQQELNLRLRSRGYRNMRLTHRLSIPLTEEENRHTNAMEFYVENPEHENPEKVIYRQEAQYSKLDLRPKAPVLLGRSHVQGERTLNAPMDFSGKNFCSVSELQKVIKGLMFPTSLPEEERFDLKPEDYLFLRTYMSQLPRETTNPDYRHKPDNYCKFFLYGDDDQARIPDNIRIFNKIGLAYGFCIDNAYVIDFEKGIEFLLTAVIYANENETLNDGIYEYDTVAFPFLAKLGQMIYDYELQRPRDVKPNLEEFRLPYEAAFGYEKANPEHTLKQVRNEN